MAEKLSFRGTGTFIRVPPRAWVAERRIATAIACGLFPLIWLVGATVGQAFASRPRGWPYALDFHPVWSAAHTFVVGGSPYPPPTAVFEHTARYTGFFVYPLPVAAIFSPLGALPYPAAAAILIVTSIAAIVSALWLLGVRDWRCYGTSFATPAVVTAVSYGTLTPLFVLALAVAWRRRDSPWIAGVAIGLAVVAKLFLWPLLLWFLIARRWRAAAVAGGTAVSLVLVSWARLGFRGMHSFVTLMHNLAQVQAPRGNGLSALVGPGAALMVVTALAVGFAVYRLRAVHDERIAFTVMTLLALWLSPIVWTHYYALIFPLLALWRPRFGLAWLVPLLFWATLQQHPHQPWRVVVALLASAAAVLVAARGTPEGRGQPVLPELAFARTRATMRP